MPTTPISGRKGKVRIGCKCDALCDEDCKCEGVTRLKVESWSVWFPEYVALDANFKPAPPGSGDGGYLVPAKFVRDLQRQIAAYWKRQRKAWRRYQHQKRKQ